MPDLIMCCSKRVNESVKEKISNFYHDQVINMCDCPAIYHMPLELYEDARAGGDRHA